MTLAQICENLHPWDECRIINKEATELSAIALTRCGNAAALWLIQHDSSYLERVEETGERGSYASLATNRDRLLYQPGVSPHLLVDGLSVSSGWGKRNIALQVPAKFPFVARTGKLFCVFQTFYGRDGYLGLCCTQI